MTFGVVIDRENLKFNRKILNRKQKINNQPTTSGVKNFSRYFSTTGHKDARRVAVAKIKRRTGFPMRRRMFLFET
ncbi:hypothetical protein [Thalassospira sp.]|uniref:hypothetical protein n=1 Tax=Thalassospira sp. TaxID=1912094 RepID=UPI003AA8FF14